MKEFFKRLFGWSTPRPAPGPVVDRNTSGATHRSGTAPAPVDKPASKGKRRLIIGLDFGTAFTKVVIGESRVHYGVAFPSAKGSANPYLLPGAFYQTSGGICSLRKTEGSAMQFDHFKMRLLEGDTSLASKRETATFLALVFHECRSWLMDQHGNTYRGYDIDWYVNAGLPTEGSHDEKLKSVYQEILEAAWCASLSGEAMTQRLVQQCMTAPKTALQQNQQSKMIASDAIALFPEFVAQISGYVRSPKRREDIHAIVDVGAGTVDITTFNIDDRGERFAIFTKSVPPLGVEYLVKHRLKAIQNKTSWTPSPHENLPSNAIFAQKSGISISQLEEIDQQFYTPLRQQFVEQLRHTKNVRSSPNARSWKEGVPFFLCGGGANVALYKELDVMARSGAFGFKLDIMRIQKPEDLDAAGLSDANYDRLSVAYGLSYDAFDIWDIIPEDQVPDQSAHRKKRNITCDHCGGTGGRRGNGECDKCEGTGLI